MNSDKSITLENIFSLQEKCFLKNMVPRVKDRYSFIKECLEFIINRQFHEECLTEENKKEINIIHSLKGIATSNLIISTKLALYGCGIESLTLLRTSLEPITIMAYKIEKKKFTEDVSFNKAKQNMAHDELL